VGILSSFLKSISLTNDFNQYPLIPLSIKFTIKDSFPSPKMQISICYSHHHFSAHNLPFMVSISIVFSGSIMMVFFRAWIKWGNFFQPTLVILM